MAFLPGIRRFMREPGDRAKIINRRIDELAQEYQETAPSDARRAEIADEVSELRLLLQKREPSTK